MFNVNSRKYLASNAVDGKKSTSPTACTHTGSHDQAWWSVDLQKRYKVNDVVVTTRNTASKYNLYYVYGLVQERRNCSALAMGLRRHVLAGINISYKICSSVCLGLVTCIIDGCMLLACPYCSECFTENELGNTIRASTTCEIYFTHKYTGVLIIKNQHYTLRIFPPAIDIIPTLLAVVYSNGKYTN